jgi:hypothetical protein
VLTTPDQVIHRAAIEARPEYEDIGPMTDGPGFYAFRRYPTASNLAGIVTVDGRPAVRCYLSFAIAPPAEGSHISRVDVRAWMARRWRPSMVISSSGDPYAPPEGHPDGPTAISAAILARAHKPIIWTTPTSTPSSTTTAKMCFWTGRGGRQGRSRS